MCFSLFYNKMFVSCEKIFFRQAPSERDQRESAQGTSKNRHDDLPAMTLEIISGTIIDFNILMYSSPIMPAKTDLTLITLCKIFQQRTV